MVSFLGENYEDGESFRGETVRMVSFLGENCEDGECFREEL